MKSCLRPGLDAQRRIIVDPGRAISFMGEAVRVYATAALISDIEYTCRDMLLDHLDEGEDSVGARVELDHLAPTPVGMAVDITVTIVGTKGRLLTFEVAARDARDEIGRGRHVRAVVDKAKIAARVARKRE
jgi:predicted thioesterase